MARILISGGSGQVGTDLQALLVKDYEVLAPSRAEWDLSSRTVPSVLADFDPDYLVNCAAFTKVDACESQRELAWQVNAVAPEHLALACHDRGIPLLHLSTDYVFDGRKSVPQAYVEDDEPSPLSVYGESKLEGERQVHLNSSEWIVLRTSWIYGAKGRNFLKAILARALKGEPLKVVDDQFGAPTWSAALAAQIARLIGSEARGLYHASAEGVATWWQVAVEFFRLMEIEAEVKPCSSSEFRAPALRPTNSLLENRRLKAEGLHVMSDWKQDLAEFVRRHREDLLKEAQG